MNNLKTVGSSVKNKIYKNKGNQEVYLNINQASSEILDVGCGAGSLAARLQQDGHIIDGITLSKEEATTASQVLRSTFIHNLETGLPPEIINQNLKYDFVICSHVLEHICFPQKLLTDIKQILKPGGKLIIALPNLMHYRSRLELLKGNFNYQESGVWDYTHFRWYTFKSGQQLLQDHGFIVQKAWVSGEIPFYSWLSFLPDIARKRIFTMLTNISKGLFGGQLLYIATI